MEKAWKKFKSRIPFLPEAGKKILKKIAKKFKKLNKLIPVLFQSKEGWGRPRKRKKNFSPEFRSYSTRARKFQKNSKKIQKIKKPLSGIISIQNGLREAEKEKKNI